MHRNTLISLGLVFLTAALLFFSSCNSGTTVWTLADLQGTWDLSSNGTGYVSNYYSLSPAPKYVTFTGVYSIFPNKIEEKGYEWDWTYDGTHLQFNMLKSIPIADYSCGMLLLQGNAQFDFPNIEPGSTETTGVLTLNNATVVCDNNPSKEGQVTGSFSVHMVKR
ncbi:MAG: hypothetical protein ABIG42_10960 [bacterium]